MGEGERRNRHLGRERSGGTGLRRGPERLGFGPFTLQQVELVRELAAFAREVASQIDIALQRKRDSVSLRLGDNFATVKDRAALIAAVEDIIASIRAAFPNKAAPVVNVDVKIGDKWLTRGRVR